MAPRRYAAISSSMRARPEPVLDLPHRGAVGRAQPGSALAAARHQRRGSIMRPPSSAGLQVARGYSDAAQTFAG